MKKIYLFALIMSIITGFTVFHFVRTLSEKPQDEELLATVVVAKQNINENTVLTADMVEERQIPQDAFVSGWAKSLTDVVGKMTPYPLVTGESVFISKLIEVGEESGEGLSLNLPGGQRAITVDVSNEAGVGGYIRDGDYVDLIALTKAGDPVIEPHVILEKIKVLKVGSARESNVEGKVVTYTSLTLSVTVDQALIISKYDNASSIIAVLRPLLEEQAK